MTIDLTLPPPGVATSADIRAVAEKFGLHLAGQADDSIRAADAIGLLTEEWNDKLANGVEADIRATAAELGKAGFTDDEQSLFIVAACKVYSQFMGEHAAAQREFDRLRQKPTSDA